MMIFFTRINNFYSDKILPYVIFLKFLVSFVLISMSFSFNATSQVSANFTTVNSTNGCESLIVEFQDLSTGSPTTWLWDFGNGNTSTLKNPIAIYNNPGIYDVKLTVSDLGSTDSKTIFSLVKVFDNPEIVILSDSSESGCIPLTVNFENLVLYDSSFTSFLWDFGDGGFSNSISPIHTYNQSGEYDISLLITDINGCQTLSTSIDDINAVKKPISNFSVGEYSECDSSQHISFINLSQNADLFSWDLGNGVISNIINPSNIYNYGHHSVSLISSNNYCSDTLILNNLINIYNPINSDFSVSQTNICIGNQVDFINLTNDTSLEYKWQFGDSSYSQYMFPQHYYLDTGLFSVTLISSYNGMCADTMQILDLISVNPKPSINSVFDSVYACNVPYYLDFNDSTSEANSWFWEFGDGNVSTLQNPTNIYVDTGSYDVSLIVGNIYGCSSSILYKDLVNVNYKPNAEFVASPLLSCAGSDISFDHLNEINALNWFWDFGDGNTSYLENPIYQYNDTGHFDVKLIVSNNICRDTLFLKDYIEIIKPSANFIELYNCDNPTQIKFSDLSIGADEILWDFGDSTFSSSPNPLHDFLYLGEYNVTLKAVNYQTGCEHNYTKKLKLTKPEADFDYLININNGYKDSIGCVPKRVYLDNKSTDWYFYEVHWSDGIIEYGRTDHVFEDTGLFDVKMIVTDIHGCKDTSEIDGMFHMYDVKANFSTSINNYCDSVSVLYTNNTAYLNECTWFFGDSIYSNLINPTIVYNEEGSYNATLFVKSDKGCMDTLEIPNILDFVKTKANFEIEKNNYCLGEEIILSNNSIGNINHYYWDFGDGNQSNQLSPNYSYNNNGLYNILLVVIDSSNCSDSIYLNESIAVESPSANFNKDTHSSSCPPLIASFNNLSSNDITNYYWDFGDSSISNTENPSHLYSDVGLYSVSLIVENQYGCKDTMIQNDYVNTLGIIPSGFYSVSDSVICSSDTILFTANTLNSSSFYWDFGDGNYSFDSICEHTFSDTGVFYPTLIISSFSDCQMVVNSVSSIEVEDVYINLESNLSICQGDSIQLDFVSNASQYNWINSNSLTFLNIQHPIAFPQSSEMFYVEVSKNSCSLFDSVYVNVFTDIPESNFNVLNNCENDSVNLLAVQDSTLSNLIYLWSNGTEGINNTLYLSSGSHEVTLTTVNLDNMCQDSLSQFIQVFDNPEINISVNRNNLCVGEELVIRDNLNYINSNSLFIKDQEIYFINDTSLSFDTAGIYTVKIESTSNNNCTSSDSIYINVNHLPNVDFHTENTCAKSYTVFTDLTTIHDSELYQSIFLFENSEIAHDSIVEFYFDNPGQYDITLVSVSEKGCIDSVVKRVEIYPSPVIDFTFIGHCLGDTSYFRNSSFVNLGNISEYIWTFETDKYYEDNFEYLFSNSGTYNVNLLAVSDRGCKAQRNKKILINKKPQSDFDIPSKICRGDTVNINYLGNNEGGGFLYHFSDGYYSDKKNLSYIFNDTGVHQISLDVTSVDGCKSNEVIETNVYPSPIAEFISSDVLTSELNSNILFTNLSKDAISYEWNFGNGIYSFDFNTSFNFNIPGNYQVSLISTNDFGCASTFSRNIQIIKEFTFYVPDGFSPNNDGVNDEFKPYGTNFNSYELEIYDRYGGLIYVSNEINKGWDGKSLDGIDLNEGIYIYNIVVHDMNNKTEIISGQLNLIR